LELPPAVTFDIGNQTILIRAFDAKENKQNIHQQAVNIIASGPSIANLKFADLVDTATIFVNGSISLTAQHNFTNIVGYVISDARFIKHQPDILRKHYTGQPLYATLAVLEALAIAHPSIIIDHHSAMRIIYPANRPWGVKTNKSWFSRILSKYHRLNKKIPLSTLANQPNFVIDVHHQPAPIGLSLHITNGFVEAGTVAYIAAQLAFSRHAGAIHLYGIDLLNSNQPRFYEAKDNSSPSKLDKAVIDRIVPSFDLLGKAYRAHGVNIINHSPVSKHLF
jgi:Kdo-III transferase WaaZ